MLFERFHLKSAINFNYVTAILLNIKNIKLSKAQGTNTVTKPTEK